MHKYLLVLMATLMSGCSELIAFEQEDPPKKEVAATLVFSEPEPPTEVGPVEEVEEAFQP